MKTKIEGVPIFTTAWTTEKSWAMIEDPSNLPKEYEVWNTIAQLEIDRLEYEGIIPSSANRPRGLFILVRIAGVYRSALPL